MIGIVNMIVSLWFLPMTMSIIIPLVMLFGYTVYRIITPKTTDSQNLQRIESET